MATPRYDLELVQARAAAVRIHLSRRVTWANLTAGDDALVSDVDVFLDGIDEGASIVGPGIPIGTTVTTVDDARTVTLSDAALNTYGPDEFRRLARWIKVYAFDTDPYTAAAQIRKTPNSAELLSALTPTFSDPGPGAYLDLTIDASETTHGTGDLPEWAAWDLKATSGGFPESWLAGQVHTERSVTP